MKQLNNILVKVKVESPLEMRVVDEIRSMDLHKLDITWTTQFEVDKYRLDIAFPKEKIALEIDGFDYHSSPAAKKKDKLRDEYLAEVWGWVIERVPGWFAYKHPDMTTLKALRHIDVFTKSRQYRHLRNRMITFHARELRNEGYEDMAKLYLGELK